MEYSKGEWKIQKINAGCKEIIAQDGSIFSMIGFTDGLHDEVADLANAQLISAAPDMYEALKKLLKVYGITEDDTDHIQSWKDALNAIRKAEGKC